MNLAPNGKPSNLTPEQYRLVRTPAFKAWFGDWENDSKNSGKISGITKEPTIWYHSTKSNFISKKGENVFKNPPFFFGIREEISEEIVRIQQQKIKGRLTTKPFFVKYKNPFDITKFNILLDKKLTRIVKNNTLYNSDKEIRSFQIRLGLPNIEKNTWLLTEIKEVQEWIISKGFDSFFVYEDGAKNLAVFNPNQIKLADGTNTTFDSNNPDIRYAEGGGVKETIKLSAKNFFTNYRNINRGFDFGEKSYSTGKPLRVYRDFEDRIILLDGHHRISDKMTECMEQVFGKNLEEKHFLQKKYIKKWLPCVLKLELMEDSSVKNPVDILGAGTPFHYRTSTILLNDDDNVDGIIVLSCPQTVIPVEEIITSLNVIGLNFVSRLL